MARWHAGNTGKNKGAGWVKLFVCVFSEFLTVKEKGTKCDLKIVFKKSETLEQLRYISGATQNWFGFPCTV